MSVDFSNVKVGDRIKLTNGNGDESLFTVSEVGIDRDWIGSERFAVYMTSWDTLEILEKPLPTRTGAMIHDGKKGKTYFVLNSSGAWLNDSGNTIRKETVQGFVRDGWKVVFEGLEYDA